MAFKEKRFILLLFLSLSLFFLSYEREEENETYESHQYRATFKEECCHESCSYKERITNQLTYEVTYQGLVTLRITEYREKEELNEHICEYTVYENLEGKLQCNCFDTDKNKPYPCGQKCSACFAIFRNSQFYCGEGLGIFAYKCGNRCNSKAECKDHEDEVGCSIKDVYTDDQIKANIELRIKGEKMTNYGEVYIFGRPVCDDYVSEANAKVACRMLGYSSDTKAFFSNQQYSDPNLPPGNFIIDDLKCKGNEATFGDCKHITWNDCTANEKLYVMCVNPLTISLDGVGRKGVLSIDGFHICDSNNKHDVCKLACTNRFQKDFPDKAGVPCYQSDSTSHSGDDYYIDNIITDGTSVKDLKLVESCNNGKILSINCAKCTQNDLLEIVKILKVNGSVTEVYQSVIEALNMLQTKCHDWDCSQVSPEYPEFCYVEAALIDARRFTFPTKEATFVNISTTTNYQNVLKDLKKNIQFYQLQKGLVNVTRTLTKSIGNYFSGLASFDEEKGEADLAFAKSVWEKAQSSVKDISSKIKDNLAELLKYAFAVVAGDLATALYKMAAAIANMCNPVALLGGGSIIEVLDAGAEVGQATAKLIRLAFLKPSVDDLDKIRKRIFDKVKKNNETYTNIARFINAANNNSNLLPNVIDKFLKAYNDFTPAVNNTDIAEYIGVLTNMIESLCDIVQDPQSLVGSLPASIALGKGLCPTTKSNIAIFEASLTDIAEQQNAIMDSYADIARAKVAQNGAQNIVHALDGNMQQQLNEIVVSWKIKWLIRHRVIDAIKKSCDKITYMNLGFVTDECKNALKNPDADVILIINHESKNMADMGLVSREVLIPAKWKNVQKEEINLSTLFEKREGKTNGYSYLTIPDDDWLLKNYWIMDPSEGPFFLQNFNLFLPANNNGRRVVIVTLQLLENNLNGKNYLFEVDNELQCEYTDNPDHSECDHPKYNAYDILDCGYKSAKVCVNAVGSFGMLLPRMSHSKWMVSVKSNGDLGSLFPNGTLYLKAHIAYIGKSKKGHGTSDASTTQKCCKPNEMFDQSAYRTPGLVYCKPCPPKSSLRLGGYFCETCPAGFAENDERFGCKPCDVGWYKADDGPGKCEKCPAGQTTANEGARSCK